MKTLFITIAFVTLSTLGLAASNQAEAGTTLVYPSVGGGFNAYHQNGGTTMIRPNVGGGATVYRQNGSTATIRPNVGGGFIIYD